jgi:hypothetical protein
MDAYRCISCFVLGVEHCFPTSGVKFSTFAVVVPILPLPFVL